MLGEKIQREKDAKEAKKKRGGPVKKEKQDSPVKDERYNGSSGGNDGFKISIPIENDAESLNSAQKQKKKKS